MTLVGGFTAGINRHFDAKNMILLVVADLVLAELF